MSVYEKLMRARIELQSKKLAKSGENKFAKYSYFELADFLPTAQQIFLDLGLCGYVSYTPDTATLTIRDLEGDGEILITSPMSTAALKGCHEVQNLGAVQTYLRRYLWVTALEIVEHDTLDSTTGRDSKRAGKVSAIADDPAVAGATSEETDVMRDMAMEIIGYVKDGRPTSALAFIRDQHFDGDQKTLLWSMLDAHTRSAIKTAEKAPHLQAEAA